MSETQLPYLRLVSFAQLLSEYDYRSMLAQRSGKAFVRIGLLLFLLFVLSLFLKYNFQTHNTCQKDCVSTFHQPQSSSLLLPSSTSIPTISRILYLFLCEDQDEINVYINAFPSITADIMFYCWKNKCANTNFTNFPSLYVKYWSGRISNNQSFIQLNPEVNYLMIKPRVFIINEQELKLPNKTTWTTARNILYEKALLEENRQGWRWTYFNFGDGDFQVGCDLQEKLLKGNQTNEDEFFLAQQFRSLVNIQQSLKITTITNQCFLLFDTFLLTVSPAIGVIGGIYIPAVFEGLLAQVVYHIDAIFNAIHRDALQFVLPYCPRYDNRSWWSSQVIFIFRSLCLYGHVVQFNPVAIIDQKHRDYPRGGDSWDIDQDMNLVPPSLVPYQGFLNQGRAINALVLKHYSGWSLEMTTNECRTGHTSMNPITCKVGGKRN